MTVTRTPLGGCPDYCPAPRDPDAHVCPHCQGMEIHHHHVVSRGMGGSKSRKFSKDIVQICPWLHEEITLHRLSDAIIDIFGERLYRVWDIHNNTVCEYKPYWIQGGSNGLDSGSMERVLVSNGGVMAGATGGGREGQDDGVVGDGSVDSEPTISNDGYLVGASTGGISGSSLSAEALTKYGAGLGNDRLRGEMTAPAPDYETAVETSPNVVTTVTGPGGVAGTPRPFDVLQPLPPDLSLEEWIAWGEMLGKYSNVTMWRIGEWLAYGEERSWGQKYTAGIEATGKSYSTLSSYVSVVKAFENLPATANLSFSVYQALAPIVRSDPEKGVSLLLTAETEHWTGTEARATVRGLTGEVEVETRLCNLGYSHRL